jgi:hypothetical protein
MRADSHEITVGAAWLLVLAGCLACWLTIAWAALRIV